jgi:hypothetical protein
MSTVTDQPSGHALPARPPRQPVRVDAAAAPDPRQSRWLWLVKWLLLVPHYIVLAFLWVAFVALTVVAFVAVLFTGRYPRTIFNFNVGVLRWTWRVQYYGYGALGTDRYPPFTLDDVPDYPAHLEIAYPERLSRGLVLVKWLLAVPHYFVLALLLGWSGGDRVGWLTVFGAGSGRWSFGGLIQLLVLVAAVVLLFRGHYPRRLYDLVIGLDRWVLRVVAYVALMTDTYPPFHLDQGGPEPIGADAFAQVGDVAGHTGREGAHDPAGTAAEPGATSAGTSLEPGTGARASGWTGGRIAAVVIGAVLGLTSLGLLAAGGTGLVVDHVARHDGYLTTSTRSAQTPGYALISEKVDLGPANVRAGWTDVVGTIRVRAASNDPAKPVFVGIARTEDVARYLDGVAYSTLRPDGSGTSRDHAGGPLTTTPAAANIWVASSSGGGQQTLTWRPHGGNWTLVLANADGSAGVAVGADLGATVPHLGTWSAIALSVGGVFLVGGVLLIAIPIARQRTVRRSQHG